jgi:hypothetical protein
LVPAWHSRKAAIPLALAAPVLPPRSMPKRPIFVVGCPRSGTTILFRLLEAAPGVATIRSEGHALWETFHHPREHGWESNALGRDDVGRIERRYVAWAIRLLAGGGRFVDKTPRNVLRLAYLDAMFPDATFVYLYREGRAIVASLYERWIRKGAGAPYRLPGGFAVEGLPEGVWWFVLPPGWRALNGRPLEEVCAFQYVRSVEAMLEFAPRLAAGRLVEVRYEDLCRAPVPTLRDLLARLELTTPEELLLRAKEIVRPLPDEPKWHSRAREIEAVLPVIGPMLDRTGYRLERS